MSSPSHRRQRSSQSATHRRSTRQSQSDNNAPSDPPSQLASSPIFFQSSSPGRGGRENDASGEVSSPLRQMTDSQSTNAANGGAPSSPLRQMSDTQSVLGDQATPRASQHLTGGNTFL